MTIGERQNYIRYRISNFVFILPCNYFAISGLDGQGIAYLFQSRVFQQLHLDNNDLSLRLYERKKNHRTVELGTVALHAPPLLGAYALYNVDIVHGLEVLCCSPSSYVLIPSFRLTQRCRSVQAKCQKTSTSKTYQVVGHLFYMYENSFPLRVHEIDRQLSGLPGFLTVLAHYRYLSKDLEEGDRVRATRVNARSVLTHCATKRGREAERDGCAREGRTKREERSNATRSTHRRNKGDCSLQ